MRHIKQSNHQKTEGRAAISVALTLLTLSMGGCGGGSGSSATPTPAPTPPTATPTPAPTPSTMGDLAAGESFFQTVQANGNNFSCANCHSISEDQQGFSTKDGLHRPAHPLYNAVNRSSFYNQSTSELLDAVNICLEDWMDADTLADGSQDWLDISAFLTQQSDAQAASEILVTQIDPIDDFSNADLAIGQTLFNQTCATCHNENATGSGIAPDLTQRDLSMSRVAQKVRTSGPTSSTIFVGLNGGNMPFWSQQRLDNEDLKHIAAYVSSVGGNTPGPLTCAGNDHPKVGQVANLSTNAHEVSGRAEIINNCTIEITSFNYDGGGPDVFFYTGLNGNYQNGNALGTQLNGQQYSNETIVLSLSTPADLDSFDGLSVWCVLFAASFGDGLFQ
jgi:mono/diheme cytochrome c family protein